MRGNVFTGGSLMSDERKIDPVSLGADVSAFFTKLIAEGVPLPAAIALSGQFVQSAIFAQSIPKDPDDGAPWKGGSR